MSSGRQSAVFGHHFANWRQGCRAYSWARLLEGHRWAELCEGQGEADDLPAASGEVPVLFGYSEVSDVHDNGEHLSFFMREEPGAFAGDVHRPLEAVLPALEEFHALRPEGLVHGDFKPWNVRWRRDGRPHFFDFEEAHTGDIREDIEHYQSLGGMRR